MCTVSYLPITGKKDQFIFTSNRDEAPNRSSHQLCLQEWSGQQVLYPKDSGAGGTWIAISDHDRLICILNGAFAFHHRQTPYRRSRGLMALDYFFHNHVRDFGRYYIFQGMEPFTAIIWEKGQLWEVRWDGQQLHLKNLATDAAHLWSSATLYDAEAQNLRNTWFEDWKRSTPHPSADDVMDFHTLTGKDDEWNGIIMNRHNRVRTVSITQIKHHAQKWDLNYQELLSEQFQQQSLALTQKK